MRTWKWSLILMLSAGLAVQSAGLRAEEPQDDEEAAEEAVEEQTAEEPKEQKAEETPIKRLVELKLDEFVVPARQINLPLPGRTRTLQEVLEKLDEWREDEKVGAVLLNLSNFDLSIPNVEELRAGVAELREAGKKVFCYLNASGPNAYLLACATDEIAIAPVGGVVLPGFGYQFPFYKGNLELRGLEAQVVAAGRYKYPGFDTRREPNKHFIEEFEAILDSWYDDYKRIVAEGRDLDMAKVEQIVDTALFQPEEARNLGLVDVLAYYDDYRDRVLKRERFKKSKSEESDLSKIMSLQDLVDLLMEKAREERKKHEEVGPKIAILHARGPIIDFSLGPVFSSMLICRDDFIEVIDQIRRNKSIKAVVMQIDSPGGSGYASDMIWKKLRELDEKKPLVVCMQRVAGSGGYYIACPARLIFAQPTTITGSIGVLGMKVSPTGLFNRLDFDWLDMERGKRSMLFYGMEAWDEEELAFIQDHIDWFYEIFLGKVAETRKLSKQRVREIAEGRIYTGRQAAELGLVDRLGGLDDAVDAARELADIPPSAELKLVHYPRPSSLGELFEGFMSVGPAMELFARAAAPAIELNFEQQLMLLSQRAFGGGVLTWMPLPDLPGIMRPAPVFPTLPGLGPLSQPSPLDALRPR